MNECAYINPLFWRSLDSLARRSLIGNKTFAVELDLCKQLNRSRQWPNQHNARVQRLAKKQVRIQRFKNKSLRRRQRRPLRRNDLKLCGGNGYRLPIDLGCKGRGSVVARSRRLDSEIEGRSRFHGRHAGLKNLSMSAGQHLELRVSRQLRRQFYRLFQCVERNPKKRELTGVYYRS